MTLCPKCSARMTEVPDPASDGVSLQMAIRLCRGTCSQASAAAALGRTQTWWSYIENGKRRPNTDDLEALSRHMGLRLEAGRWMVAVRNLR